MENIVSNKPLQRISWSEKTTNDFKWFKTNADYLISASTFQGMRADSMNKTTMKQMYDVYNNAIPMSWFTHITDPLSAKDPKHKKFPAKIRPTNILRTNIDLLLSEWLKRRFRYMVQNLGENGYNQYMDTINKAVNSNIQELFMSIAQQEMKNQGVPAEQFSRLTPDQVPLPEDTRKKTKASYKDKIAMQGQSWLKRAIVEYNVVHTLLKGFKDYLLAGEVQTYKGIEHGELVYKQLNPQFTDYDKSPDTEFLEDGEWVTHMYLMTISDVVDLAYDKLKEKDHASLEHFSVLSTPTAFYDYVNGLTTSNRVGQYIPVYQTTWKGKKQVGILHYKDPETGEPQEMQIDEAEKDTLSKYGEDAEIEWMWVNEWYETWRAGNDIYFNMQPVIAQRNALNNFSTTKGPINGRRYSDTNSQNISIAQVGVPYLIMYMIVGRALELTIAKSKGKIMVLDNNAIPRGKGWNEEKFFYYSEALGYATLDRNQIGVDKSFNQYTVLDMTLFDSIQQLISLQQHYKQEWDDIIGITRQRKGQTLASETNSSNEEAIFRSTVITEMIFNGYDEFRLRELQGLLDLSKFTNANGLRRYYNGSVEDDALLEITPEEYSEAPLGIMVTDDPQDEKILDAMKAQAPQFIQNDVKPSTLLAMFQAGNVPQLKAELLAIEEIESQMIESQQQNEQAAMENEDERKMRYMEYEKILEEQLINVEYDRKDMLEEIKGQFQIQAFDNKTPAETDSLTADAILKNNTELEKVRSQERQKVADIASKERTSKIKEFMSLRKTQVQEANKARMNDKKVKADITKAHITKRAQPKKK